MIDDRAMELRLTSWLEDGPTTAASWVTETVLEHARRHPRRGSLRVRWANGLRAATAERTVTVVFRPVLVMLMLAAMLALAGVGYLAWRQNSIVPPIPTLSPSAAPPSATPAPSIAALHACPAGTNPDLPGPADQIRPPRDTYWQGAVDSKSGLLVIASGTEIWTFDLCTNTWRDTHAETVDGRVPVYDPAADLVVMIGTERVTTFDAGHDLAVEVGSTPVTGRWSAAYNSAASVIIARDARSGRLWAYDPRGSIWHEFNQAGEIPPAGGDCGVQLLDYDESLDRLVLYSDLAYVGGCESYPSADAQPATYLFNFSTSSWSRQPADQPRFNGPFDWPDTHRPSIAYDAANEVSVVWDAQNLLVYDAGRDRWTTIRGTASPGHAHVTVPIVYDPVNQRIVLVGADPDGKSGNFENWVADADITAVDLRTSVWVDLLPWPSIPPVTGDALDAQGDAAPAKDIVAVHTSATLTSLTLQVTLAQDWPTRTDGSYVLFVEWVADNRPYAGAPPDFGYGCNPWVATYRSMVTPRGGVESGSSRLAGQTVTIDGRVLTLVVPLASFENPYTLGFSLTTPYDNGDYFPDDVGNSSCHAVPLVTPD